jgi:crossover junction endonuclease MUS81
MQFQGKQIMTAKSQVQVINGFFLKETHKLADTIDYLVTMTKVIKAAAGDLHVIPSRYLSRTTYASLQTKLRKAHQTPFLTSYEAFQELNKKSTLRTTKEYLARMLLVVKGMSPERVSAVLDVWETPRALFEAMKERHAQGVLEEGRRKRGPELMFADMVPGEGRRKIGDALSKAVSPAVVIPFRSTADSRSGTRSGARTTASQARRQRRRPRLRRRKRPRQHRHPPPSTMRRDPLLPWLATRLPLLRLARPRRQRCPSTLRQTSSSPISPPLPLHAPRRLRHAPPPRPCAPTSPHPSRCPLHARSRRHPPAAIAPLLRALAG